jgi:hypothetical protein
MVVLYCGHASVYCSIVSTYSPKRRSNKMLYAVEGVDPYGRKFTSLFTEEIAREVAESHWRLNKEHLPAVERGTNRVVYFTLTPNKTGAN